MARSRISAPGILLLYHREVWEPGASTIGEHVASFAEHSAFPVWEVNTDLGFPRELARLDFDAVVLHYSLFGRGSAYELTPPFLDWLAASRRSRKIAFFQDEYRHCRKRFRFVDDFGIDTVYTLFEPRFHEAVWRAHTRARTVITVLPGYVSRRLLELPARYALPDRERPLDIGYRARRLDFSMGEGGQEKHRIGSAVRDLCRERYPRLRLDIEVGEAGRLYGEDWHRFIGSCRGVLGVESGVSLVDIDDDVLPAVDRLLRERPEATFEEVSERLLRGRDHVIPYRTISPRHFEAAALRTCQILFEGSYSGILKPDRHYLALKKDCSNFDEVMSRFTDPAVRAEIAGLAYNEIVASGEWSYAAFMRGFDERLAQEGLRPPPPGFDRGSVAALLRGDEGRRLAWSRLAHALRRVRRAPFPGRATLRRWLKGGERG